MTVGKMVEILEKNKVCEDTVIKADGNWSDGSIINISYNKEEKVLILHTKCNPNSNEALDKQIPKKIVFNEYKNKLCPNCKEYLAELEMEKDPYCSHCGQRLEWKI